MSVKLQGSANQTLWGATVGFFVGFAAVSLFNVTALKFKVPMHLNPASLGLLMAMPLLSGSFLRIPFSAWVDRNGGRKPVIVLLSISILGVLGVFLTAHALYPKHITPAIYPWLLFLGLLSGCGIATFSPGISQVAFWFPKRRQGWALGAYAGFGNLAPGLFVLLMPLALAHLGLSTVYLVWLALLAAGTGIYALFARNAWYFQLVSSGVSTDEAAAIARAHGAEIIPVGKAVRSLALAGGRWETWGLVMLYFTTFGGFLALTVWLPNYLHAAFGKPIPIAARIAGGFSLASSLVRVFGGAWADKFGGRAVGFAALVMVVVGGMVAGCTVSFEGSLTGIAMIMLGMGINNAAVFKLLPNIIPQAVSGAAGWVGGLGALGGFVLPPLWGEIADSAPAAGKTAGYSHGMLAFSVLGAGCMVLMAMLRAKSAAVPNSPQPVVRESPVLSQAV